MNHRVNDEQWKLLSDLISAHFGLVFPEGRRGRLEDRLRERVELLRLGSFAEYYRFLVHHPSRHAELRELPQLITNNETYFFRETHQFQVLTRHVLQELAAQLRHRPLRILSAGCSSGDEPYSIVVSLQEAAGEISAGRWAIDACDLSPRRLLQARQARYPASHLRACDEVMRRAYFEPCNDLFQLRPRYRRDVHFFEGNLVAPDLRLPGAPYDVIFCRNVLIYFSELAFHAAVGRFHGALRDGGYLFLGHAESLVGRRPDFQPVRINGGVVYRKIGRSA
jgi:chemotaxis protein methyltransferase CheR